jgi:hypothetical protein
LKAETIGITYIDVTLGITDCKLPATITAFKGPTKVKHAAA